MPRGDRTGPLGLGPMTGRRAGYCAGYNMPGYANPAVPRYGAGFGGGFGGGFRAGLGWRGGGYWGTPRWQYPAPAPLTPQQESEALKAEANWLKNQLEAIEKRIEELENR